MRRVIDQGLQLAGKIIASDMPGLYSLKLSLSLDPLTPVINVEQCHICLPFSGRYDSLIVVISYLMKLYLYNSNMQYWCLSLLVEIQHLESPTL